MLCLIRKTHGEVTNVYGPFNTLEEAWTMQDRVKKHILGDGLGIDRWVLSCTVFWISTLQS